MKFSIATPVYNGISTLRMCVGSVRGQLLHQAGRPVNRASRTTLQHNDLPMNQVISIQHVVQDGGSSDGSREFLKKLCTPPHQLSADNYQLTFTSEVDKGMYDAINKAWEKTDGDILSWLNSDEQYLPGTLEKVAEYFNTHPEVDVVFGNMIITYPDGNACAARREIPLRRVYVANGFLYAASCTTFFRRRLWEDGLLKLDTTYRYSADADLALRLLKQGVNYGHINEYLSLFSVEDGQNLSFDPAMDKENAQIKLKHGAFKMQWMQSTVMLGRRLERVLLGCYQPDNIQYKYAIDERPNYRIITASGLKFRFTYDKFSKSSAKKERRS